MKIKYQMPNKKNPTHIVIGHMKIREVASIIAFLESQNILWEYVVSYKDDNK